MDWIWIYTIIAVVLYLGVNIVIKIADKRKEKKLKEYERNNTIDGNNTDNNTGNL